MTVRTAARRRLTTVAALLATCALTVVLLSEHASGGTTQVADSHAPRDITVVGDSITAKYDDTPGSAMQGWWSFVGRHYGSPVDRYAQSGSGYLRPGQRCTGTTFGQRLHAVWPKRPALLVIEGGRNDWATCQDGQFAIAEPAAIKQAVNGYLDMIEDAVGDQTRVLVLGPPWGPLDHRFRTEVTSIIQTAAAAHHMQFVGMDGVLDAQRVMDGIHPNRTGSEAIARRVITAIDHPEPGSQG